MSTSNQNTNDNNSQLQVSNPTGNSPSIIQNLGISTEGLTEEQKRTLTAYAVKECIDLKINTIKDQNQLDKSSREMDKTIQTANALSETSADFSIHSEHKTATGNTSIKVSNYRNMTWGGILLIVGVIALILLAKGC